MNQEIGVRFLAREPMEKVKKDRGYPKESNPDFEVVLEREWDYDSLVLTIFVYYKGDLVKRETEIIGF